MRARRLLVIAASAACGACGAPQAPPPAATGDPALVARIDAYLAPYVAMKDFAGSVLVARGPRVLVHRGCGDAPERAAYAVGSIGKTVTAAAIELLAARGKLALTDPIGRYLPALPEAVTLQGLLDHRAGIPDYYGFPEFAARHGDDIPLAELVALIAGKPLDFPPGRAERYSNSGYALLAAVVERVTGEHYAAYVARELFAPLGMTHTGDLTAGRPRDLAPGRDPGFAPEGVQPASALGAGWLIGNGSLVTTADDLWTWLRAVRAGTLVSAPVPYGWGVHDHGGHKMLEQDGRIAGYAAYVGASRDDDITVIVLGNIQSQAVATIGPDLAELARGNPVAVPAYRRSAGAGTDEPPLAVFAGRYRIAPDFVVTVAATPRGLTLAGPDGIALPLDREGPTAFFFRPLHVALGFDQHADRPATRLLWAGASFVRDDSAP